MIDPRRLAEIAADAALAEHRRAGAAANPNRAAAAAMRAGKRELAEHGCDCGAEIVAWLRGQLVPAILAALAALARAGL